MAEKKSAEEPLEDSQLTDMDDGLAAETGSKSDSEVADDGVDMAAELDKLRQENLELKDRMLRAAADFENMKKRVQRDKDISLKYAEEHLLRDILSAVDNLERALGQDQDGEDFGKNLLAGVELTLKGMLATLEKFGLTTIDSVGQSFDPSLHEAMVMEASDEVPAQSIIGEYEKGYMYKDRLLRAAKVVVSKGSEEE